MEHRISVVTGANRGIGFEICRQLARTGITVLLTARDRTQGDIAAQALRRENLDVWFHPLDVTSKEDIHGLVAYVKDAYGRLDVLVNNAGIYLHPKQSALEVEIDTLRRCMEIDVYGHVLLCQQAIPLMQEQQYGRIVNMSSIAAQLSTMKKNRLGYRIAKTALNVLTVVLADEVKGENILINCMTPGWVKTDMGGEAAPRSIEQGADTAVWLATLPNDGPTGSFFFDRQSIPW